MNLPLTFDSSQIRRALWDAGVPDQPTRLIYFKDQTYVTPDETWPEKVFRPFFTRELTSRGIKPIDKEDEGADCDEHVLWSMALAKRLHVTTPARPPHALLWGDFGFTQDSGVSHNINWTAHRVNGVLGIYFYDATPSPSGLYIWRRNLSPKEIKSCELCIA